MDSPVKYTPTSTNPNQQPSNTPNIPRNESRLVRDVILRVAEAKHLPKVSGVSCQIWCGQRLVGFTVPQWKTCNPLWGESFHINVRSEEDMIKVKLNQESQKKGRGKSVGKVMLDLSELLTTNTNINPDKGYNNTTSSNSGDGNNTINNNSSTSASEPNSLTNSNNEATEEWYPIFKKGKSMGNAALRLEVKYEQTVVLASSSYNNIVELLKSKNYFLLRKLAQETSPHFRYEVCRHICNFGCHLGNIAAILKGICIDEINNTDNLEDIFRSNSVASKSVDFFMRIVCDKWLLQLKPLIQIVHQSNFSCEVVASKMNQDENVDKNIALLTNYVQSAVESIFSSGDKCPLPLREILQEVKNTAIKKFSAHNPDAGYIALTSLVFLRLFIPAIKTPKLFGLTDEILWESNTERTLTLVATILQKLGNFRQFSVHEPHIFKFNGFLQDQLPNLRSFLDGISTINNTTDTGVESHTSFGAEEIDFECSVARLVNYLQKEPLYSSLKATAADSNNDLENQLMLSMDALDKAVSSTAPDLYLAQKAASSVSKAYQIEKEMRKKRNLSRSSGSKKKESKSAVASPRGGAASVNTTIPTTTLSTSASNTISSISSPKALRPRLFARLNNLSSISSNSKDSTTNNVNNYDDSSSEDEEITDIPEEIQQQHVGFALSSPWEFSTKSHRFLVWKCSSNTKIKFSPIKNSNSVSITMKIKPPSFNSLRDQLGNFIQQSKYSEISSDDFLNEFSVYDNSEENNTTRVVQWVFTRDDLDFSSGRNYLLLPGTNNNNESMVVYQVPIKRGHSPQDTYPGDSIRQKSVSVGTERPTITKRKSANNVSSAINSSGNSGSSSSTSNDTSDSLDVSSPKSSRRHAVTSSSESSKSRAAAVQSKILSLSSNNINSVNSTSNSEEDNTGEYSARSVRGLFKSSSPQRTTEEQTPVKKHVSQGSSPLSPQQHQQILQQYMQLQQQQQQAAQTSPPVQRNRNVGISHQPSQQQLPTSSSAPTILNLSQQSPTPNNNQNQTPVSARSKPQSPSTSAPSSITSSVPSFQIPASVVKLTSNIVIPPPPIPSTSGVTSLDFHSQTLSPRHRTQQSPSPSPPLSPHPMSSSPPPIFYSPTSSPRTRPPKLYGATIRENESEKSPVTDTQHQQPPPQTPPLTIANIDISNQASSPIPIIKSARLSSRKN